MVKTHNKSRFSLLTLAQIRDSKEIILQIEDTRTEFTDGQKCFHRIRPKCAQVAFYHRELCTSGLVDYC